MKHSNSSNQNAKKRQDGCRCELGGGKVGLVRREDLGGGRLDAEANCGGYLCRGLNGYCQENRQSEVNPNCAGTIPLFGHLYEKTRD